MGRASDNRAARLKVLWNAAMRLEVFAADHLAVETRVPIKQVREAMKIWRDKGLIEFSHRGYHRRSYFKVTALARAMPSRTVGGHFGRPQSARLNMWRAMRALKTFTARDVAIHATTEEVSASEKAALDYCQMLARSGHLRVAQKAAPGRRPAIYKMVRNTGPYPPQEKRLSAVWDENLEEFTYIAGVTS